MSFFYCDRTSIIIYKTLTQFFNKLILCRIQTWALKRTTTFYLCHPRKCSSRTKCPKILIKRQSQNEWYINHQNNIFKFLKLQNRELKKVRIKITCVKNKKLKIKTSLTHLQQKQKTLMQVILHFIPSSQQTCLMCKFQANALPIIEDKCKTGIKRSRLR